uniref:Muskelin n=1 Tax=Cacopsylla melanoneura TaxID=428564 RepID=A0A8D9A7M5_9HEMI
MAESSVKPADESLKCKKLEYNIHSYSSYSTTYVPENIKVDKSNDQSSRWSSDSNFPRQYLVLKLDRPAIVKSITFGKFEKMHVCNLKKFKIFGGMDENTTIELLDWGLKNDSNSETFDLKHSLGEGQFPCSYIRIEPIQSWGPSFNFSVWYVELRGDDDRTRVKRAGQWLEQYRDLEITKLCMKYFRQKNQMEIYNALQSATGITLEHPLLTQLFNILVHDGDYEQVEQLMTNAIHNDYLAWYISQQDYRPCWSRVSTPGPRPGMRGGHQMVLDPLTQTVYLLGGWDGTQDLSDLWSYSIRESQWTLICPNVEYVGGPTPRSCHKLCLDPERRQIFVLGRYLDQQLRQPEFLKSDFYQYDIDLNIWTLISWDTSSVGGPRLIFDHQMCLDSKHSKIFVFGGRVLTPSTTSNNSSSGQSEERLISNNSNNNNNNNLPSLSLPSLGGGGLSLSPPLRLPSSPASQAQQSPSSAASSNPGAASGLVTVGVTYELIYSGLYAYHIPTSSWEQITPDSNCTHNRQPALKSRAGHSMLFHPELRKLYIFAGQRNKEYLNDFISYNVDTHDIENIQESVKVKGDSSGSNQGLPASGFTRRATIDPVLNEIYVLSGLSKEKEKREETVQNSFWVYQMSRNQWSCVYKNENSGENYWTKMSTVEPCPRFAHQLVYDSVNKVHYLFGGNPGKACSPRLRLDDFWCLSLCRPTRDQVLAQVRLLVRKAKFQELSLSNRLSALEYLQTSLSELIDHDDKEQSLEFRTLAQHLFMGGSNSPSPPSSPPTTGLIPAPPSSQGQHHQQQDREEEEEEEGRETSHMRESLIEGRESLTEGRAGSNRMEGIEGGEEKAGKKKSVRFYSREISGRRGQLYKDLSEYFPDSMTPPQRNLQDIVRFTVSSKCRACNMSD